MTNVCILTAGKGTRMGDYSSYINKALLPLNQKAIISSIIEKFPTNYKFVIAIGYLGGQVKSYISLAHPGLDVTYVNVENFDGPNSGPGHSLLMCRTSLVTPFYFVACDTLWNGEIVTREDNNWVGVAEVDVEERKNYCNFEVEKGVVRKIIDKQKIKGEQFKSFIGLGFIKDVELFWDSLSRKLSDEKEHQVSMGFEGLAAKNKLRAIKIEWTDLGNLEKYQKVARQIDNFDFSKTDEFIYIVDGSVIKFNVDKEIIRKKIEKYEIKKNLFPEIQGRDLNFMSYKFIPGQTMYQSNNPTKFRNFLEFMRENVWELNPNISTEKIREASKIFYKKKTLQRVDLYRKKYPSSAGINFVNGNKVKKIDNILEGIDWDSLYPDQAFYIHGDLQFDNVIFNIEAGFKLLDWRQDFGGIVEAGDIFYDFAKLLGGIRLNYDLIKANLLQYSEDDGQVFYDYAVRSSQCIYEDILKKFINTMNFETQKIELLVPLIYLNMAPLHHYPFDKMLYSMAIERLSVD